MRKIIIIFSITIALLLIAFYSSSHYFANAFLSSNHVHIGGPPDQFKYENVEFKTNIFSKGGSKRKKSSKRITKKEKEYKPIKGYKAVEWIRKVRDKMYEENKKLDMKNYVKAILKDK